LRPTHLVTFCTSDAEVVDCHDAQNQSTPQETRLVALKEDRPEQMAATQGKFSKISCHFSAEVIARTLNVDDLNLARQVNPA
jgi:hypothetical protein